MHYSLKVLCRCSVRHFADIEPGPAWVKMAHLARHWMISFRKQSVYQFNCWRKWPWSQSAICSWECFSLESCVKAWDKWGHLINNNGV
jgi:hypothetical protein